LDNTPVINASCRWKTHFQSQIFQQNCRMYLAFFAPLTSGVPVAGVAWAGACLEPYGYALWGDLKYPLENCAFDYVNQFKGG
jgi:hypothetical protein